MLRVYRGEHMLIAEPQWSDHSGLPGAIASLSAATAPEGGVTVVVTRPSPLRMLEVHRVVTVVDQLPDALTAVAETSCH